MNSTRQLARELATARRAGGLRLRQGTVTAVNADRTVSVQIGGSAATVTTVPCLTSAAPRVNQSVLLLTDGRDLFVLGSVADNALFGFAPVEQNGTVSVSFSASASGNAAVSFPWAFPVAPKMQLTASRTGGGKVVAASDDSVTASGLTVYCRVVDGTSVTDSVTVKWRASYDGT